MHIVTVGPVDGFGGGFCNGTTRVYGTVIRLLGRYSTRGALGSLYDHFRRVKDGISPSVLGRKCSTFVHVLSDLMVYFNRGSLGARRFGRTLGFTLSFRAINTVPRCVSRMAFNTTSQVRATEPGVTFVLNTGRNMFPGVASGYNV